jgi:pimeloyl-ACP methyl ester carboxylesterase
MRALAGRSGPPSTALLLSEGRAPFELWTGLLSAWLLRLAARGDGHPVLVLPGLLLSARHTLPLRLFLAERGWSVYDWGAGANRGNWSVVEDELLPRLYELRRRHGRRVSLVGWSLGGLFARALALRAPDEVRCVVTLGTQIGADCKANNVWPLYESLSGEPLEGLTGDGGSCRPLAMPCTALYSRSDGMGHWRGCLQPGYPGADNVEVVSSHYGMPYLPYTLFVVADRLARPEGEGFRGTAQGTAWRRGAWPALHGPGAAACGGEVSFLRLLETQAEAVQAVYNEVLAMVLRALAPAWGRPGPGA